MTTPIADEPAADGPDTAPSPDRTEEPDTPPDPDEPVADPEPTEPPDTAADADGTLEGASEALADLEGPQGDPEEQRLDRLAPLTGADTAALESAQQTIDEAKVAANQVRQIQGEVGD